MVRRREGEGRRGGMGEIKNLVGEIRRGEERGRVICG